MSTKNRSKKLAKIIYAERMAAHPFLKEAFGS
jgi:hypothetical protein